MVNTGNVPLSNVSVTDDRLGPVACPARALAPGRVMTCHASHVVTMADIAAGRIVNAGRAAGDPPSGPPVTSSDDARVTAIHGPGIQLDKIASPGSYTAAGQPIAFSYRAENTGNVTLHDIVLTDDKFSGPVSCPATSLAPGASMTCHATYTTTTADAQTGYATNVGAVTGRPPAGPRVTGRDEASVTLTLPVVPVTG